MITLDNAAEKAAKFAEIPGSIDTLRRWARNEVISKPIHEEYYGGFDGREVFYHDSLIIEIITAIRLKNNYRYKFGEISKARNFLETGHNDHEGLKEVYFKKVKDDLQHSKQLKEEKKKRQEIKEAADEATHYKLKLLADQLEELERMKQSIIDYVTEFLKALKELKKESLIKVN